jgi:hypothetical protein
VDRQSWLGFGGMEGGVFYFLLFTKIYENCEKLCFWADYIEDQTCLFFKHVAMLLKRGRPNKRRWTMNKLCDCVSRLVVSEHADRAILRILFDQCEAAEIVQKLNHDEHVEEEAAATAAGY